MNGINRVFFVESPYERKCQSMTYLWV